MKSPITSTEHVLATASNGVSLTFSGAGSRGGSTGGLDGFAVFFAMHSSPASHTPGRCYHYSGWRLGPLDRRRLQPQVGQTRVVVGAAAERPVVKPLRLLDSQIVDAGVAPMHQAVVAELPHFVAVRSPPLAGGIVRLVSKAHRDAIVIERPQFLDEPVFEFARPLAGEECNDLLAAVDELRPVAPAAVD